MIQHEMKMQIHENDNERRDFVKEILDIEKIYHKEIKE